MNRLLYGILFLLIMSPFAVASDTDEAEKLIKSKLEGMFVVLQKTDQTAEERNSRVIEIIEPAFDFERMAKLTLGRKHWPGLAKEKKKQFTDLFVKRLKESYLGKLNLYTNERIVYKPPIQVKTRVHVPTELISKDNVIDILYKLYKTKDKKWLIYDLEIQGVSIIKTYKTQFDQVLRSGTIDDLLAKLENPEK